LALFFLAMSDWQLGEKERARQWYAKAVQAMAETKVHNVKELWGFRNETAQLLGMLEQLPAPKEVP
jgi:hypothetical protein